MLGEGLGGILTALDPDSVARFAHSTSLSDNLADLEVEMRELVDLERFESGIAETRKSFRENLNPTGSFLIRIRASDSS